jgi:hypothetical protein
MSSDSMILTVANRLARHPPFDRLQPQLLDVCDGGDIFGVRALLADRRGIRTLGELLAR